MGFDFLGHLDELLQDANERKTDEGAPPEYRRKWAIVYTDLEKMKAFVIYLIGGDE